MKEEPTMHAKEFLSMAFWKKGEKTIFQNHAFEKIESFLHPMSLDIEATMALNDDSILWLEIFFIEKRKRIEP